MAFWFGARSKEVNEKKPLDSEVGLGGFKQYGGYVFDDLDQRLNGVQGRRVYREMKDNDATVGAFLYACTSLIRAVDWHVDPAENDHDHQYAEWFKDTLFNMPEMTWDDTIGEIVEALAFGFSLLEIVGGKKPDGTIGLRKLAPRAQESIDRWEMDQTGNVITGVWQLPPNGGGLLFIPLSKLLHFTTCYAKGNPEGRSVLRNAYKSYYFVDKIENIEAIGIERDLAGLPVMYAPTDVLADPAKKSELQRVVRDVKMNQQGGIVLPSDPHRTNAGDVSSLARYRMELLSSSGSGGKVDADKIIRRHQAAMARSILADFLLLGGDGKGSYALSSNKTDLFTRSLQGVNNNICQTINRQLIDVLWAVNGFPIDMKPKLRAGNLSPVDLGALGDFLAKVSGAGVPLNDRETEDYIRDVAGLPPAPDVDPLAMTGLPNENA